MISIIFAFLLLSACTFLGHKEISKKDLHKVREGNFIIVHNEYYQYVLEDVVFSKDRLTGYKVKGIGKGVNDFNVRLKKGTPLNTDSAAISLTCSTILKK
jgi:hypothetical protein